MSKLFWLSDAQWAAIAPHLPKNQPGARRVDDLGAISGIFHVLKLGCRWCDCPGAYGPSTTIYNRYNRWSRKRFWTGLLEAVAHAGAAPGATSIDSTFVKAQRAAFGCLLMMALRPKQAITSAAIAGAFGFVGIASLTVGAIG